MKGRKNFIFIVIRLGLIFAIVLVLKSFISPFLPNSKDETNYWEERVETLQEENAKLQAKNAKLQAKNDGLQEENAKLQTENHELQEENSALKKKLSEAEKEIEELSKQRISKSEKALLNLLFPKTEATYEMRDSTFQFYSDSSCDDKYLISRKLTFVGPADHSYECYHKETDSTYTYYVSKSNENRYVYSKFKPYFYPISE